MKKFFVVISIFVISIACGSDDSSSNSNTEEEPVIPDVVDTDDELRRSDLLVSWADDFIIPQFEAFLLDAENLIAAKDAFVTTPNEVNLVSLRENLTTAYTRFQPVAAYSAIGKAEELNYYLNLNAHALDVDKTLENIAIYDTVDLTNVLNQTSQGLPAVDYLVNGLGVSDAEIVAFYTGDDAVNYNGYLSIVVDRIENLTQQVVDDWNTGYRETFIENTSSTSSGSFDIFINAYIEYFEQRLRSSKVGLPAGVFTSTPFPDQIESLYNPTLSKNLLITALDNAENLYIGLDDSEISLSSTIIESGNEELDTVLKGFFDDAQVQIDNLNDDLKLQIETDNSEMLATRDALQKIVGTLKADLTSVLGVDITFVDNDGD